jgi:hypothetical protein
MSATIAPAVAKHDVLFKAFADPTRLRILNVLAAGELCVCDLVDLLDLPQPNVSPPWLDRNLRPSTTAYWASSAAISRSQGTDSDTGRSGSAHGPVRRPKGRQDAVN